MKFLPLKRSLLACTALLPLIAVTAMRAAAAEPGARDDTAVTPIKHIIVIVGENRSYDHVFATWVPPKGFTYNLLSEGIIDADGSAGNNVAAAAQLQASDTTTYSLNPSITGLYRKLPPPTTGGVHEFASDTDPPPFATVQAAENADYGLESQDYVELTTGASGLPEGSIDTRIPNATKLPNQPFPLTGMYDDYVNSPIHRFFQSWQQADCSVSYATADNPAGCRNDLFPWVDGTDGFNEGATAQGFYNVQQGDMPYFLSLANQFAVADNYHQPVRGGTGANSIMLGYGDMLFYSDGYGNPTMPPAKQIENPDPRPGTNNRYVDDGYSAGSYTNCSDLKQRGVAAIRTYLKSLPWNPAPNCAPHAYYLMNNYNPGFNGDGTINKSKFTIPPSSVPSIADDLDAHQISWAYYGEYWNAFVANQPNAYCNICNPFLYETQIMTNRKERAEHLKDTLDLYADIQSGKLPAVSYVKPGGLNDGHPASSKFDIYEAFVKKILDELQANPKLFKDTAVFITTDEAGGYYDTGYTQPLDFFGDGNRIPLIVVSNYSKKMGAVHSYNDHASVLKFIEANWSLPPVTGRSRDNMPNPKMDPNHPYVPTNGAAIGDLMDFFNFK
jgi:phospholipase C